MTAIKNGIKSIIRTPWKTLLFVLILTVTSALLTVSCCVFAAARGYLNDCSEYFHTIAELEYIGQDYPNPAVYDEGFAEAVEKNRSVLESLVTSETVKAWEPASTELMYTPLIHRFDTYVPEPDAAVLQLKLHSFNDKLGSYNAIVTETLYSRIDYTDKLIMFRTLNSDQSLELGGTYLIAGQFFAGRLQNPSVKQEIVSFKDNEVLTELPAQVRVGTEPEAEALFQRYAESLHIKNDACRVTYTAAVEDLYPFHQQVLTLTQGRYFTAEEYDSKARVCIVSEKVAGRLDLKLGDSISFTIVRSEGELYDASRHTQVDEGEYQIVGITNHSEVYPYWIYLPDADVGTGVRPVNGYTLGQFRLKNDRVPDFLELAEPLLDQGFRLNVYDQGYAAATGPIEELLFISGIFLAVCLLLAACAMVLQSYLFISRQSEVACTMYAMGSGRAHVCIYFLSASMALTVSGVVLGAVIGKQTESRVFSILQRFATQFAEQDLRFSASRIAIARTLDFNPASSVKAYLTAAGILAGGTLLLTLLFALSSMREKKKSRKKVVIRRAPKRAARASRLSGFLKYGLLSIARGRVRTVAVLLLCVAAAMFFGRLTTSLAGYQDQLTAYKANAEIAGSATDYLGKQISGLIVDGEMVAVFSDTDLVKDCCATTDLGHIRVLGVEGGEQIPFFWPEYGSFAYESAFYWLSKENQWIGTSSVSDGPLFHYTESGSVEWLDGWGETDFIRLDNMDRVITDYIDGDKTPVTCQSGPAVCALPNSMMDQYGIRLGDTINTVVAYYHPVWYELVLPMQLLVVASYAAPAGSTTVYSPVTLVRCEMENRNYFPVIREGADETYLIRRTYWTGAEMNRFLAKGISPALDYSSFTFTLTDSARVDELRETLADIGFTWVRSGERSKPYAIIEDEMYLNTTQSMERQIQYVGVLYDALYIIAGVIGLVLAWLLTMSRRQEIAVMRAMGTQPHRILLNFLFEQAALSAIGIAIGGAISYLTGCPLSATFLILCGAFWLIWNLSTLICLITGLLKPSYASLTEPE